MCKPVMRVQVGRGDYKQVYERCPDHSCLKLRENEVNPGCPKCGLRGFYNLGEKFTILERTKRKRQRSAKAAG